jgi:hypothetical protein
MYSEKFPKLELDLFPEIPLVFELTKTEAHLITALLDHCRGGNADKSDFRTALHSLQNKFDYHRNEDGAMRISFTKEKTDGSRKTYHWNSKSFITIEVD